MNETTFEATYVTNRIVESPSGEQYSADKIGKIGEMVQVRLKQKGIPSVFVMKTLDSVLTGAENRAKSLSTIQSGKISVSLDDFGSTIGVEYDNCVIVEVPNGFITDFTFKDYTNTTLITDFIAGTSGVYLNGVRQLLGTDYTEISAIGKIVFSVAPNAGDLIIIKVRKDYTFLP